METSRIIKVVPKKVPIMLNEVGEKTKRRVAAYARVSTDLDDQKNSFNAQLEEYESRIEKNPDWEFVGLYSDEGISGTSIKKRIGFTKMIDDAKNGKIDLILIKSISRFARNTVDCIATVRELRKANVEVYFDKEAISTNDTQVNLMLTMCASFAEEESHSISENVKWGVRKRMAKGQRKMVTKTTIGYLSRPDGTVVVDESEREIVERIFNLYLIGYTYREIADEMMFLGIKTGSGKAEWNLMDVGRVLTDEKYIGKHIMQKTVVKDFLDHKAYINDGIEPKYIEENHHESIIKSDIFDIVQTLIKKRYETEKGRKVTTHFLFNLFYCEDCLREMKITTNHPGSRFQKQVYTCKKSNKSSLNFKNCTIVKTLNYNLVKDAVYSVLKDFSDIEALDPSILMYSYKESLKDIQKYINEAKDKMRELEDKLTSIIKHATESTSVADYKFEFDKYNKEINFYKDKISEYEEEMHKASKSGEIIKGLNDLFTKNVLTYNLVSKYIGGVIRKIDGSIRIILSKERVIIDSNTIDSLMKEKPIYEGSIKNESENLIYDVIRL